ncbi:MAG TPA: hypothetical protein VHC21_00330 [Candidatus Saccharimonadales bacterium]|nr:hypothetical protein [Candidatus Saccharimonadales bacterium]
MVANKNTDTEGASLNSDIKVGSGGQAAGKRWWRGGRPTKRALFIFTACILLVVIIILAVVYIAKPGQKVYAQAAGHKIYKKDVDNLIGTTQGVTAHQATVVLADKYLTEAMAKKAGITVGDSDVTAKFGPSIVSQKNTNKYVYQSDLNSVYFDKLLAYTEGLYKGQLIVANFSRHIAFQSPALGLQEASDPLMGNASAIAQDKQYADNFITNIYNEIKTHKITFDQAIQEEHDDPQLGLQAYQTLPHSGSFDTSNIFLPATPLILPKSIQGKIHSMKAGQISAPFVVSVNNSLTKKNVTTDSYYLIVKMDSTKGGNSGLTYAQYLNQSKQKLGYKVYV